MYALDAKVLPNTRYFVTYSGAVAEAKALGLGKRSHAIRHVSEPVNPRFVRPAVKLRNKQEGP